MPAPGRNKLLLWGQRRTLLTSLISFWELEEASGTRNDAHGTNHLADNNTVTQAAGKVGNAAQFTAANTEYLSIADNASLSNGDSDFTIGAWVYLDTKAAGQGIFSKRGGVATAVEYELRYVNTSDRFLFSVGNGAAAPSVNADALGAVSTATWYFVLGWHDSVTNTINIQVNNGTVNSTVTALGMLDSTNAFLLGSFSTSTLPLNGRIDQAFVIKRLLTTAEKTFLYNAGAGRSYAEVRAYRG